MYHLPLLPGYDPGVNVRSSAPTKTSGGKSFLTALSEAEDNGYEGTYFPPSEAATETFTADGFIPSSSPGDSRLEHERERMGEGVSTHDSGHSNERPELGPKQRPRARSIPEEKVAEAIFFAYGVVVFYGLSESQERDILEDIGTAGIMVRRVEERLWEIEECHYTVSVF